MTTRGARGRAAGAPALPILGPRAPRWPRRPPATPRARAGPAGVAAAPPPPARGPLAARDMLGAARTGAKGGGGGAGAGAGPPPPSPPQPARRPAALPRAPHVLTNFDLDVVGVGVPRAVGDGEVRAVLPRLRVGVLRVRLVRVGRVVAELPGVLERRRAALDVGLELDGERRRPILGRAVGPGEERRGLLLALTRGRGRRGRRLRRSDRGGGRRRLAGRSTSSTAGEDEQERQGDGG